MLHSIFIFMQRWWKLLREQEQETTEETFKKVKTWFQHSRKRKAPENEDEDFM